MHTANPEANRDEQPSSAQSPVAMERAEASPNEADSDGFDPNNITGSVIGYIEKNPLIATAAALAVGAAVVMIVKSRTAANNTLDRRAMRVARGMERTFAKEMRAIRNSDLGAQVGQFGQSIGQALGKVDLSALAEMGRNYAEAARAKIKI